MSEGENVATNFCSKNLRRQTYEQNFVGKLLATKAKKLLNTNKKVNFDIQYGLW